MNIFSTILSWFSSNKNDIAKPVGQIGLTPAVLAKIKDKNNRILITAKNLYVIGQNLNGCLTDAANYQAWLISLGFDPSCFKVLLNENATGQNERDGLIWLGQCTGSYAFYINSSHGLISNDGHEATACYDFSFDDDNGLIKSVQVQDALKNLSNATKLVIINDACHSNNDLLKDFSKGKAKTIINPFKKSFITFKARSITDSMLDCVYFGGCQKDQTSADAYINNIYCGALSYYLLFNWKMFINPIGILLGNKTTSDLHKNGYEQTPSCEGPKKNESIF